MHRSLCLITIVLTASSFSTAAEELSPIRRVEVRNRAIYVNDEPFFPIMAWLQNAENFPAVKQCGMNTSAGYWPTSSGTKDVTQYLPLLQEAGLYGVMPYHQDLKGQPNLLGYILSDEPDLPHQVNDAEVVAVSKLRLNRSTPLWKIVDGVPHSWSVLDPMESAEIAIRLPQPATLNSLGFWLTISKGLAVAKDVEIRGDGQLLATASLEAKKGRQVIDLPGPASVQVVKVTVRSVHPGEQLWGSISEIEGFDADGKNVLLSPPRNEPRAWPKAVAANYARIKASDPTRPVFMTLTGNFHPKFGKWTEEQRKTLYPAYIRSADVVGFDIYPIYGWNKPEWIHLVHDATEMLVSHAGSRPVYAWIETSKGGQYTGDLAKQHDVTPEHIRAEVWMAICRGATAIGYFTHVWKPAYSQFGVPEANRQALAQINSQISRLAPVILTGEPISGVRVAATGGTKVDWMTRRFEGRRYVFLVNYDERAVATDVKVSVDGLLPGQAVAVGDEGHSILAQEGCFRDHLDPFAVRLYRLPAVR